MKGGAASGGAASARTGAIKSVSARHLGDGKQLMLSMQAMSYDQAGRAHMLVRLQPLQPVSAALDHLIALKDGTASAAPALNASPGAGAHAGGSPHSRPSSRLSGGSSDGGAAPQRNEEQQGPREHIKHRDVADWVRQASHLPVNDDDRPAGGPRRGLGAAAAADGDGDVALLVRTKARGGAATPHAASLSASKGKALALQGLSNDDGLSDDAEAPLRGRAAAADARSTFGAGGGGAASSDGGGGSASFHGSMADGSEMMSNNGDDTTCGGGDMGHDEDLAVDTRRAKRLKKVQRMLSSGVAQAAVKAWRQHTLILLAVICAAHVCCFVVLTTQVDSRYSKTVAVNQIGQAMASSSQATLRANFLQKCQVPQSASYRACSPSQVAFYGERTLSNARGFSKAHQSLCLGADALKPFQDVRLLDYWTYKPLPELVFIDDDSNPDGGALVNSTRTLWDMCNLLVQSALEVYNHRHEWGEAIINQSSWQYVNHNGPASIFTGYVWSLDTFVDYTWRDLTSLSITLIILLVLEAVVVQLSCMLYEFVLLQRANMAHMRMFSIFLALPSATVRFMTRKPMIVDDSTNDDLDEEDLDLIEAGAGGGGAASQPAEAAAAAAAAAGEDGGAPEKPLAKKSVRLAADLSDGDDDDDRGAGGATPRAAGKKGGGKPGGGASTSGSKAKGRLVSKPPVTGVAAAWKKTHKLLFGWLDPRFKRNGKRLLPSSLTLAHFMVPLLLWVGGVVVIYGVSFQKLQGLQGPLASLDLSAHVLYQLTRARLASNLLAFATTAESNALHRAKLRTDLDLLRHEYNTLLYGGPMLLQANIMFDAVAPSSVFTDSAVSDLFFKTRECTRKDRSTCLKPGDDNYEVTHTGLDIQLQRYLDAMDVFASLPDELALANHSTYEFTINITAKDTYDGLQTASELVVQYTLSRLESVKQLHTILLAVSLVLFVLFVVALYRPYIRLLHRDTRAVVSMLSSLPAEVDVEGHVRAIILGSAKAAAPDAAGHRSAAMMVMVPLGAGGGGGGGGGEMMMYGGGGGAAGGGGMMMMGPGMQQPGGRGGMWGGPRASGGGGGSWFAGGGGGARGGDAGGGGAPAYAGFCGGSGGGPPQYHDMA